MDYLIQYFPEIVLKLKITGDISITNSALCLIGVTDLMLDLLKD